LTAQKKTFTSSWARPFVRGGEERRGKKKGGEKKKNETNLSSPFGRDDFRGAQNGGGKKTKNPMVCGHPVRDPGVCPRCDEARLEKISRKERRKKRKKTANPVRVGRRSRRCIVQCSAIFSTPNFSCGVVAGSFHGLDKFAGGFTEKRVSKGRVFSPAFRPGIIII